MKLPSPEASLQAHVRALLAAGPYPSTLAVADALGWDAAGTDDHARRTHRMVHAALSAVADFTADYTGSRWQLRAAPATRRAA